MERRITNATKLEIRAVIRFLWAKNYTQIAIHKELVCVYGQNAPSRQAIIKWCKAFDNGRENITDEHREGRPITASSPERIEKINALIQSNREIKLDEIAQDVGIAHGTAAMIVHNRLAYQKVCATWIPRLLTDDQQDHLQSYDKVVKTSRKELVCIQVIGMPPKRDRTSKTSHTDDKNEKKGKASKAKVFVKKRSKNNETDAEEPAAKRSKTEPKPMMNKTDTDLNEINFDCTKANAEGKKYNLKISSWNVSGIRALIKKNGMDYILKEDADIVALQETKCDKDKLPDEVEIKGYNYYYVDSKKQGYCGVALYTKEKPLSIQYGLNNSEFDDEGRMITAEYQKFYLINVYVPNAGQKLVTLPKRLKWNEVFKAYVKKLDGKKPVIICGDMNVAHQEIDLKNPKTNTKNAGFTKEEREGMTDFLDSGFVDTFRDLYPDRTEAYTFWSYFANARSKNIGWRLDYYLVSERIKEKVCDNVIRDKVYGSDHCPIVLYINI